MDPEKAHHLATLALRRAQSGPVQKLVRAPTPDARLNVDVFGQRFEQPLGMAAGFDKEAQTYNALLALGFGHVEIGTVTPLPQPGNSGPRMQRFPEDQALVNRLGFPGPGMNTIIDRLENCPAIGPIGINIGPNKQTPADQVGHSLYALGDGLSRLADYIAINVSSPNTPGLRALQTPEAVARLVTQARNGATHVGGHPPILLKVHPDAKGDDILAVARAAVDAGAAGIIATNTTKERTASMTNSMDGGMSGAPLRKKALATVEHLHHGLGRDTPIIGVGGIMNGEHAYDFIRAGASLVQTYTGFIYGGPRMPVHAQAEMLARLDADGHDSITEAIGN